MLTVDLRNPKLYETIHTWTDEDDLDAATFIEAVQIGHFPGVLWHDPKTGVWTAGVGIEDLYRKAPAPALPAPHFSKAKIAGVGLTGLFLGALSVFLLRPRSPE